MYGEVNIKILKDINSQLIPLSQSNFRIQLKFNIPYSIYIVFDTRGAG